MCCECMILFWNNEKRFMVEYDYLQSHLVIVYFQTEAHFSLLVSRTNDGKYSHSKQITAVHCHERY